MTISALKHYGVRSDGARFYWPRIHSVLGIEDNTGSSNPRLLPKICEDNYEKEYHILGPKDEVTKSAHQLATQQLQAIERGVG